MKKRWRRLCRILSIVFWGFVVSPIAERVGLPVLKGGFVFLVHPRTDEDLYLAFPFFRFLGRRIGQWILNHLWPVIGPPITGVDGIRGRTIFCPWTVEMMLDNPEGAQEAIQRAADVARNLGAGYLGTGALTASMTRLGRDLRGNGMVVTTGHAATTLLGARILLEALRRSGIDPETAAVAVVGAGGNIGGTVSRYLLGRVRKLLLLDLDRGGAIRRMHELADQACSKGMLAEVIVVKDQVDYKSLFTADGVFTATSATDSFLKAAWLKPGAVLVEDSQPLAMSYSEAAKHDGLAIQVLARIPGVDAHFRFQRGVGREVHYTCLAELIALALDGGEKGVTGPVTARGAARVEAALRKAGYDRLVFQSYGRAIDEELWTDVRQINQPRLEKLVARERQALPA